MDKKGKQEGKRKKKEGGNRMKEIRGWSSMVTTCLGWGLTQSLSGSVSCNLEMIVRGSVGRLVGSSNPSQLVDGHDYYSGINSVVYDKPSYIQVYDKSFVFVSMSVGESPV